MIAHDSRPPEWLIWVLTFALWGSVVWVGCKAVDLEHERRGYYHAG